MSLYQLVMDGDKKIGICLKQEPRFATLPLHGERCQQTGLVAWSQCVDLEEENCQLTDYMYDENAKCQMRARQVAAANDRDKLEAALAIAKLNSAESGFKQGKKAYDYTLLAITSPIKFFQKALTDSNKTLIKKIFPGLTGSVGRDDPQLAEQVYKFAYQRARTGTRAVSSAGIAEIQEASLRQIDFIYADIFRQLDTATHQMQASESTIASTRFDPVAARPAPRTSAPVNRDCEVLDNFASSSALRDRDPDGFLALVRRCDKH